MIIFLYGEDSYRSHQRLYQIKEDFKKKDRSFLNLTSFDIEKGIGFLAIKKAIFATPFLTDQRIVIIKNLITSGSSNLQEKMVELVQNKKIPKTTTVIFWENKKPNSRKVLFRLLLKHGQAKEFNLLSGWKLNKWIEDEVKTQGGFIEREAVGKLASYVGSDLWQMASEIKKLITYKLNCKSVSEQRITADDIKLLVRAKLDDNIFSFVDALGQKDKKRALKLLHDQIASGQNVFYLLTMIAYQLRNLLVISDLAKQRKSLYQISYLSKIHPYVVSKTLQQIKNFNLNELKKIYRTLLEADIAFKRGSADSLLLMDLLVTKLCS